LTVQANNVTPVFIWGILPVSLHCDKQFCHAKTKENNLTDDNLFAALCLGKDETFLVSVVHGDPFNDILAVPIQEPRIRSSV
jgi:hypothetical protein